MALLFDGAGGNMRECTSGIIIPEGEPLYIHIHIPV